VLVELKGGHVGKALEQLKETSSILCKRHEDFFGIHSKNQFVQPFRKLAKSAHGNRVLGYIISNKGVNLKQDRRANLKRDFGITVRITRRGEGISRNDLTRTVVP
jgi:hypothetical protein